MRIAYLLNTYPAPSATFIRNEIEALEALGVEVERLAIRRFSGPLVDPADIREASSTVYLLDGRKLHLVVGALREILANPRGVLRALPIWKTLLRNAREGFVRHAAYLMEAAALRQHAEKWGVSHVHSHFSNNAPAVAMLAHMMGGPTFSFTAHGPDEFVEAPTLSFPLKIEKASFVVAISQYCRDMLVALGGKDCATSKIHIAHCGLDLAQFAVAPPIQATNQTFICVGRLCPQKGQVHIPAAVAALKSQYPGLKVLLVGDGDSRAEIEREISRHGTAGDVILHGWAANSEVRKMIAESRALLLPSYAEGLPVVIMEAFAMGRPVLSTTIAAIPELVDAGCGWLVPPGDHERLVEAMRSALQASPEVLTQMGLEGRARVERTHDRRILASKLLSLFSKAAPS